MHTLPARYPHVVVDTIVIVAVVVYYSYTSTVETTIY